MSQIKEDKLGIKVDFFDIPIDTDIIFSNHKKIYKKRIEKRQKKMLQKISFIKQFLKEDEKIFLVTTGFSPMSVMEQLLTGLLIFFLKRSLFVFTNKRIFHIPTKYNYSYRHSIAQILYEDCRNIKMKGSSLVIKYKNDKKEKFYYIARKERKKIKYLIKISYQKADKTGKDLESTFALVAQKS